MTPEQTLEWLAQQHFDQCHEERPIQDWIRKMKSQLPEQPAVAEQHKQSTTCGEPVALMIYRGELCYKSQEDDQSYGMWCPVTQDLPFPEGTKFYTTPYVATPRPQRKPLTDEDVEKIIKANMSLQMNLAGIRADFEAAHGIKE